ncbi:MAG: anthranilate synthase component I family protein [Phycisphaerales bacterium]|nr:MAG: anthranilate synthase component I family protein [Phycisphaerales bacterium]
MQVSPSQLTATHRTPAYRRPLPLRAHPLDVLSAWPASRPVAALLSCDGANHASRWSVIAPADGAAVELTPDNHEAALAAIAPGAALQPGAEHADAPPFCGGWIGALHYELGRCFEPTAHAGGRSNADASPAHTPSLGRLVRVDAAYIHDALDDSWSAVGAPGRPDAIDALPPIDLDHTARGGWTTTDLRSDWTPERYQQRVRAVIEYIRAGDVFQANIAHRMRARVRGDLRAIALRLLDEASPTFGAVLENVAADGLSETIVSLSPELFLEAHLARGTIRTRPIKGTRPASVGAEALRSSEKDGAELAMIVDLMRNDLGRICAPGRVRVDEARTIERHARDVLHAVATVSGDLRAGATLLDVLRATFPPGSVTGAPKVRAMQIIDELEGAPRGVYCGAVGFMSDCGATRWSVAIRTATITGRSLDADHRAFEGEIVYPVGAGIVSDSDPDSEWEETLTKAGAVMRVLREHPRPQGSTA